jgi:hypothetical protein
MDSYWYKLPEAAQPRRAKLAADPNSVVEDLKELIKEQNGKILQHVSVQNLILFACYHVEGDDDDTFRRMPVQPQQKLSAVITECKRLAGSEDPAEPFFEVTIVSNDDDDNNVAAEDGKVGKVLTVAERARQEGREKTKDGGIVPVSTERLALFPGGDGARQKKKEDKLSHLQQSSGQHIGNVDLPAFDSANKSATLRGVSSVRDPVLSGAGGVGGKGGAGGKAQKRKTGKAGLSNDAVDGEETVVEGPTLFVVDPLDYPTTEIEWGDLLDQGRGKRVRGVPTAEELLGLVQELAGDEFRGHYTIYCPVRGRPRLLEASKFNSGNPPGLFAMQALCKQKRLVVGLTEPAKDKEKKQTKGGEERSIDHDDDKGSDSEETDDAQEKRATTGKGAGKIGCG